MTGQPLPRWKGPAPSAGPVLLKMWELLADGEWHDYQTILDAGARELMPGKAVRRLETRRLTRNRNDNPRTKGHDLDRQKLYGARAIARDVIRQKKWFEIEPRGKVPADVRKKVRRINYPKPEGEQ